METLFLVNLLEERDDSSAGDNSDLLFPLGGPWALAGTHPEPVGRGLGEGRGLGGGPAQVFVWGTRAARPGLQDPRDFWKAPLTFHMQSSLFPPPKQLLSCLSILAGGLTSSGVALHFSLPCSSDIIHILQVLF